MILGEDDEIVEVSGSMEITLRIDDVQISISNHGKESKCLNYIWLKNIHDKI